MFTLERTAILFGVALGLGATAFLFFTVPAYHNLVVWSWTNPWAWALGVTGGLIAWITD